MDQIADTIPSVGLAAPARPVSSARPVDDAVRQLREEWQAQQTLYQSQPAAVQKFLQTQAARLADALLKPQGQAQFALPERVRVSLPAPGRSALVAVSPEFRAQTVAGLLGRLPAQDIRTAVRRRLTQLEQSPYAAVAASARLLRYATVRHIVYDLLPAGRSVIYKVAEGDMVPTVPAEAAVPAAQRFFMPEWVALGDGRLLVDSDAQAQACLVSMQGYLNTLHLAVGLAPCIFADEEYQRKHSGMLGQLVNQGRALARYQTGVVIHKIRRLSEAGELNLGFSLSLPYFDDQALEMKLYDFNVIPGRTLFVPAFVVLAARREQDKVQQNTRLNESTRIRLAAELEELAQAFDTRPAATGRRG